MVIHQCLRIQNNFNELQRIKWYKQHFLMNIAIFKNREIFMHFVNGWFWCLCNMEITDYWKTEGRRMNFLSIILRTFSNVANIEIKLTLSFVEEHVYMSELIPLTWVTLQAVWLPWQAEGGSTKQKLHNMPSIPYKVTSLHL